MPLLQMNLAARGSLFSEASVASALGHTSLAGSYESFVCGCAGCAEKAAIALDDGGGLGMFRAAGELGFRVGEDDIFRIGEDGPQFQGVGGNDTVPGSPNVSFSVAVGGSVNGRVNSAGDDDYYAVELVAGQSYVISLTGRGGDPLLDPYLELRNSEGGLLSINDDSGPGYSSELRFTATTSGTYYINARAFEPGATGFTTGDYTLSVAIGAPQNPLDTIDYNWTVPTTTIEVYFATTGQTFAGDTAVRNWTQAEINAVFAALATYSAVAPLTFVQTTNQAQAEFTLMLANLDPGVLGYFIPPSGIGAFSPSTTSWQAVGSLNPGGSAFATLVHEFGHAFGLAHPHDEGGVRDGNGDGSSEVMQGVTSSFGALGTFGLNQGVFTTMSYNDGWQSSPFGATGSLAFGSQATPMALDVALIQQRYGVNNSYNTGNNTYTLTGVNGSFIAIWDAGGNDTISYTGTAAATIDLRPATLQNEVGGGGYVSYVNNIHQGFTIAAGAVIENAVGSAGADTLIGNSANNRLTGAANNDTVTGGAGIDTSVYSVASTGATWVRSISGAWTITAGADGTDTLNTVEVLDFTDRDVVLDNAQQTFSGDGTSDVLWRNSGGLIATWSMLGATQTGSAVVGNVGAEWTISGTGDFSADGRDDILWRRDDGLVFLWNNASSTAGVFVAAAGTAWDIAGVGDFNFDGRDDFLWRNPSSGLVAIWTMNGPSVAAQSVIGGAGADWSIHAVADFDGDGRDDILWRRDDGLVFNWETNGTAQTGSSFVAAVGNEWQVAGTGDFNGDGRADLLWQRDDGLMAIWHMDGATTLSSGVIGGVGTTWNVADVGDYNGDGKDDILWRNDDGLVAVWTMNGFTVLNAGVTGSVDLTWVIVG